MNSGEPLLFALSPCTVLRVAGPDRTRFLNGQLTQDVRLASAAQAVHACVLNAKGQLDAVCWVRQHDDAYLLDAPLELRDALLARLDRYLIADDVELTDESDHWHLAHLVGASPPEEVAAWTCERLGRPGFDLLSTDPLPLPPEWEASPAELESARIFLGIPAWGTELTAGMLPPEAGLDATAISYDKGCYLGQEVISRMKRAGKTNRHLVQVAVPRGTPAPALLVTAEGAEAGQITSVSDIPVDPKLPADVAALGFRKRKIQDTSEFQIRHPDGQLLEGTARVYEVRSST